MAFARALDLLSRYRAGRAVRRRLSVGKRLVKGWARALRGQPTVPVPPPASPGDAAATAQVQTVWDQAATEGFLRELMRRSWLHIRQVNENHNHLVTGRRDYHWLRYLRDRYFPDGFAGDTLSLGCGEGHFDRTVKEMGFHFRSFTGIDVSPAAVQKAQHLADAMQLSPRTHYFVADLNQYEVPKRSYDFIFFFHSLHHIEALERSLRSVAAALRPGGLLMVNEFVGPSRFQWTPTQVAMANRLILMLPEEIRVDLMGDGRKLKTKSVTPTVAELMAGDPSEAVRSADIDRVLKQHFEILEEKPWGGTLNYLVFENIAGNFNPDHPYHRCIIELLIEHENVLVEHNILPSDFKVYMAKPKKGLW
jgi:SAM-dependent methyltransferase